MSPLKTVRMLVKALVAEDAPASLAAGFALGAMAGLLPKSSLLAHLALIALSLVRVNLAAGLLGVALFALLAPLGDPLFHRVGWLLLGAEGLKPLWTSLYNLPIVPWTRFNNTVVLGSFVTGLALIYPIYRGSLPVVSRYKDSIGARLRRFRVVQLLLGAEAAGRLRGDDA